MSRKVLISIDDFTGGLNVFDKPHQVRKNQSPKIENAVFSQKGAIRKRYGYDRICKVAEEKGGMRGMIPYIKMPTEGGTGEIERKIVVVHKGKVFSWDAEKTEFLGIGELEESENITRGLIYDNELILGDGNDETKKWDGDESVSSLETFGAPKSNCFLVFSEIFLARDSENPSVLKYADPADITQWNPSTTNNAGFIAPENNNGEMVKGLAKFQNKLICFKETGKFAFPLQFDDENALIGFSASEFDDGNDGCRSPYSILNTHNALFFLGQEGFESYGMAENYPDRRASKDLSFAIQNLLESIRFEEEERISSAKWENKYLVSCPLNNDKKNNTVLFYDSFYTAWGKWDIPMQDMHPFVYKGKKELFFTSSVSPTLCKLNTKYIDDWNEENDGGNTPIHFVYETPELEVDNTNRIDIVRIEGYMTIPSETEVFLVNEKEEFRRIITRKDVIQEMNNSDGVGGFTVGEQSVSGTDEIAMKKFVKIIQFPSTMNESRWFQLRIENKDFNAGVEINKIEFLGEKKANSLKRK